MPFEYALRASPSSSRILMRRLVSDDDNGARGVDSTGHPIAWQDVATITSPAVARDILERLEESVAEEEGSHTTLTIHPQPGSDDDDDDDEVPPFRYVWYGHDEGPGVVLDYGDWSQQPHAVRGGITWEDAHSWWGDTIVRCVPEPGSPAWRGGSQ